MKSLARISLFLVLFSLGVPSFFGQETKPAGDHPRDYVRSTDANTMLAKSRKDFESATNDYKETLKKHLQSLETDVQWKTEALAKYKELYAANMISRWQLEEGETALVEARKKVEEAHQHLAEADRLIAETKAQDAREQEEARVAAKREQALRPLWQRLRAQFRALVAASNPNFNFIDTTITREGTSYSLWATHSFFNSLSFDVGPTARVVSRWIDLHRAELKKAGIDRVGLMNKGQGLGSCWFDVE